MPDPSSLKDGQVLVGAAKTSTEPRPQDYKGTWEKSKEKCETLSENGVNQLTTNTAEMVDHLAVAGSPWPENPNCIYMGGFGIGPMNPVSSWDQDRGLWVRAVALRDKDGDDLVLAILDGEGYFWDYANKCADCGIKQIAESLAADKSLGLKRDNIVIAATHAHSSPDFIGGWGFVPDWYMNQVSDTIKSTIRQAMASMRPALLEVGEHEARPFNSERRGTYRSAEEQHLAWLRAYSPGKKNKKTTIATIGAYAAHPDGVRHQRRQGLRGLARALREEPRGPLRRHRPALHDRSRQHVELRPREPRALRRPRGAWSTKVGRATGSRTPTSGRRRRPGRSRRPTCR